ncbi:hypothetical protein BD410DRAFT_569288 [Rickenella mellea]|uniref:Uncharacterized protein n=1 Tax=Rickenella mellea TaxID=50990 RepID=A0A4Y7QES1_9AGAM|nr:hypothetical protein BD410DRAFT_569288 [Rickenella mellea]
MIVFPAFAPTVDGITTWSAGPIKNHFTSLGPPSIITDFYVYLSSPSDEETLFRSLKSIAEILTRLAILSFVLKNVGYTSNPRFYPLYSLASANSGHCTFNVGMWTETRLDHTRTACRCSPLHGQKNLRHSAWLASQTKLKWLPRKPDNGCKMCQPSSLPSRRLCDLGRSVPIFFPQFQIIPLDN